MNTLLLSSSFLGIIWLVLLFAVCFFGVHITRLAKFGLEYQKQKLKTETPKKEEPPQKTEKTPEKKPSPQPAGEPVYYIVERKKRTKSSFGEPKEIRFK